MSPEKLLYFKQKLIDWRNNVIDKQNKDTKQISRIINDNEDAVNLEKAGNKIEKAQVNDIDLLTEIDAALNRIEDRSFGFCLETGEEINSDELEKWPIKKLKYDNEDNIKTYAKN